jgi:protein-tyrosine-phosphatase
MRKKILFVCSQNTCRSAVAEAILFEYGRDRYDASSAGIYAQAGEPMMESCAQALEKMFGHGFSASSHTSQRLAPAHMIHNDLIVAATPYHAELVKAYYPYFADKVITFQGGGIYDISLLYGEALEKAIERIRDGIFEMFLNDEQ